jgi:hypothetical protein
MVPHGRSTNRTADFHAHHSPVGALASFTIGRFTQPGGPGLELMGPAQGGVTVGYRDGETFHLLPFYPLTESERERYVQGGAEVGSERPFAPDAIRRDYGWATDRFSAGDCVFEVLTPFGALPDPAFAPLAAQRDAFAPAVLVRLTVSNPTAAARDAIFGINLANDRWQTLAGPAVGLYSSRGLGFATDDASARIFSHFTLAGALLPNQFKPADERVGRINVCGFVGLAVPVAAGETRTITIALGWYKAGVVTAGRETRYWYTRLFTGIGDVLAHALARQEATRAAAARLDAELAATRLDEEQRFLVAHATRSYFGSTQLLDDGGRPRWVVNEGEYLMMNTFDLTVDMAFFEVRYHPWTLRNVLEQFAGEYRYEDQVFDPDAPGTFHRGGVSFTHDMGVLNLFSPEGRSAYETEGLDRACFSHMTCEQLLNWVCCAGLYWKSADDRAFLERHAGLLRRCLDSMEQRDHHDPARRRGIMQMESSRTFPGGEITTYDSLDHSLGQARRNLYLAVKGWAAALTIETMLAAAGDPAGAAQARAFARRAADTVVAAYDPAQGFIPAVLDGKNRSAIIPAIEGLIFPHRLGLAAALREDGPYGALITTLKRHHQAIVRSGMCLYPDGGWKLSSTADNSWMSKICLCQHVARHILGLRQDPAAAAKADRAHADWERHGSASSACSDQFRSGKAIGSLYYPRIVTNILWLDE